MSKYIWLFAVLIYFCVILGLVIEHESTVVTLLDAHDTRDISIQVLRKTHSKQIDCIKERLAKNIEDASKVGKFDTWVKGVDENNNAVPVEVLKYLAWKCRVIGYKCQYDRLVGDIWYLEVAWDDVKLAK